MPPQMWKIFVKANVANNPRDWSAMRKRELVLIIRSQEGLRIMEADINVIHQSEAGRNPHKKLEFGNFKEALKAIAKKVYPKEGGSSLRKLMMEKLLQDQSLLHVPAALSDNERNLAQEWMGLFESPMKRFFSFFAEPATSHEQQTLGRHTERVADIGQQTCSMTWTAFQNFAACANLSSGTGTAITALSLNILAGIFVDSIGVDCVDDVGGLTYAEFLDVLIRCAKVWNLGSEFESKGDGEHINGIRARLEILFLHMSNQFQTSVPRIVNAGNERVGAGGQVAGSRNQSTNSGLLIKAAKEFNATLHRHASILKEDELAGVGAGAGGEESVFGFGGGGAAGGEEEGGGGGLMNFASGLRKGL